MLVSSIGLIVIASGKFLHFLAHHRQIVLFSLTLFLVFLDQGRWQTDIYIVDSIEEVPFELIYVFFLPIFPLPTFIPPFAIPTLASFGMTAPVTNITFGMRFVFMWRMLMSCSIDILLDLHIGIMLGLRDMFGIDIEGDVDVEWKFASIFSLLHWLLRNNYKKTNLSIIIKTSI